MDATFPEYALYGEKTLDPGGQGDFWLHCEAISDRSRIHGWEIRRHFHRRFFQLLYIWGGAGSILHAEAAEVLTVPTIIEVPLGVIHGFRFSHDIKGFIVSIVEPEEASEVDRGRQAVRQTPLPPEDREAQRIAHMLREIELEYRMHDRGDAAILASLVATSRAMIERRALRQAAGGLLPSPGAARDSHRIEILRTLIAAHFREHRPVAFYAQQLQVSPAHLNRICRETAGASMGELLARQLAEEAERSLIFTMLSVKQIAFNLGFSDAAYFTRFFQRQTGRRPTDLRRTGAGGTG